MRSRRPNAPTQRRISLAHALGFLDYPSKRTADPYLNYIANRHVGRGTLDDYLKLFTCVVEHFSTPRPVPSDATSPRPGSIRALLETLIGSDAEELFTDTKAGSTMRREDVEDTVMYILGAWSVMLSSFVMLPNRVRKVTTAYNIRAGPDDKKVEAFEVNLAGLIGGSCLLPAPRTGQPSHDAAVEDDVVKTAMKLVALLSQAKGPPPSGSLISRIPSSNSLLRSPTIDMTASHISNFSLDAMDSLESLSIKATRLNAFTLSVLGAVQISWTHNLSRHMLLSRHGGQYVLEVFALPCAFNAATLTSDAVGIPSELAQEIQESYCILFNPWPDKPMHVALGRFLGIRRFCWCWSCSAYRYRHSVISKYRKSFDMGSRKAKRNRSGDQRSEYDPLLVELMNNTESSDWTQDLFPSLWSRIIVLEEHLQSAKPWSIWILFRDRRDTLQFWTFL